ncbi:tyrosine-type recombinase/integrase [Vibrio sp. Y2-5]|uniref:tyrosine-type recombinase/integrase n=1 Tax=Vibrio sp. Y2-5 TaxID=2743977 RepID=UPI00166081C6|nr:tyrosine-type recombinase/integrase [Vibrio sp. Y2-5]
MPRPRNKENRGLPEGLYFKGDKGYVFRRVDDTWKSLGKDRARAISLARRYNATYRVDVILRHELLEHSSRKASKNDTRLSKFFSRLPERYKEDERPSTETYNLFVTRLGHLDRLIGHKYGKLLTLEDVNHVLEDRAFGKSNEVYNRWISFMAKVFDYALDESVMIDNPARRKKRKPLGDKTRERLKVEEFKQIWQVAPLWLRTAMSLSLETTHSVHEVCSVKYSDFEKLDKPVVENGLEIFGYLKIHRQKVKKKEASRVRIPVTMSLLKVIENSKDNVDSPYIVHRRSKNRSNGLSRHCSHITQVNKKYLSGKFSEYRDKVGVRRELASNQRPTFHEIRALSIHLYDKAGCDPQARAAHSDSRSTQVYKEGHVQWVTVPAAELNLC